ncbi:hypothetical protein [Actinoplanes utahensis]|uniref:hypothetical protein n=1 Tax=Actinoplanes utahensis TaxID=1869 RepID=UPI0031E84810
MGSLGSTPQAGQARASTDPQSMANSSAPTNALRTGFTAADVAANRRKQAAPEHERSLAQATSGYPVVTPRDAAAEDAGDAQSTTMTKADAEAKSGAAESGQDARAGATAAPERELAGEADATPKSDESTAEAETPASSTETDTAEADSKPEPEATPEPAETAGAAAAPERAETAAAAATPERAETAEPAEKPEPTDKPESAETPDSDETPEQASAPESIAPAESAEESAAEPVAGEPPAEDKTSVVSPAARQAEEKTSVLSAPAEEKTSVLSAPAEEKTSVLSEERTSVLSEERTSLLSPAGDEKTSLLLPAARPAASGGDDKTSVVSMPPRRRIITEPEQETRIVGDVPGINRPNRPAWTPMQLRPAARRGVTIFGTTLTRRQAAIGLGIVLTFVLLVGIILVQAFGNDDAGDKAIVPFGVASAPADQGGDKASGSPAASATPSSAAPSSPAATNPTVPAGWRTYQASGFTFWVPEDVKGSGGSNMTLEWGKYGARQFRIDVVPGKNDPVEYLRDDSSVGGGSPSTLEYHGTTAAEVEYPRNGGSQRAVRRVFVHGGKTYVLTWYAQSDDWDAAKSDRDKVFQGFKVG